MKRISGGWMAVFACLSIAAHADSELQTYVKRCQSELQFQASEVRPMNCNDGPTFAANAFRVNDTVVYQRVNTNVDMVAACRWGDVHGADSTKFLSIELLIHNRGNGGTCFFSAKDRTGKDPKTGADIDPTKPVSPEIVAVTNFNAAVHPNADDFWLTPSQLNSKPFISNVKGTLDFQENLQCVRCHSQGPYLASGNIASSLANFGLLNDGHDTRVDFNAAKHYFVVGSQGPTVPTPGSHPFGNWNFLIASSNTTGCSGECHALAREKSDTYLPIGDLLPLNDPVNVVLTSVAREMQNLRSFGMPPYDDDSPYRWVNIDQPGTDAAEVETFTASKAKVPVLGDCGVPGNLEASAVGNPAVFSTAQLAQVPDKLRSFNLRDGLVCLNSDQPGGRRCNDYRVSYRCPGKYGQWLPYQNTDRNNADDGDHEERSRSIGDATNYCGGVPIAMQAQVLVNGVPGREFVAPNDRLAQFSPSGLVCRNADQGSGQSCASYTVRYRACSSTSDSILARLKNAWVNPPTFGDRFLTTTQNVDGAETRAQGGNYQYPSQDWIIEHVPGGNTVRLRDVWSGKYLTALNNNDAVAVQVKNSDSSLMRQQWVQEAAGGGEYRFRNVGSGRYLTVGNYTSDPYFAPILSQSLSNQNWASQRWLVQ